MKKLYIVMMLVLTGTMAIAQTSVWNGGRQMWTRGEGTESNPFLIESAENLAYLAYAVNKGYDMLGVHFLLTTDIDLNGSEDQQWVPIGLGSKYGYSEDGCDRGNPSTYGTFYPYSYFKGHFDGGEHNISNLYINKENGSNLGLFGVVYSENEVNPVVIENVFVTNGYIKGSGCCGGIVGVVRNASTGLSVLISRCWSGVVLECRGSLNEGVGGIVGNGSRGLHIQKCYNAGNVNGFAVGGILGGGSGEIEECYNKGDITGNCVGGIYGGVMNGGTIIINDCYNLGEITANTDYGELPSSAPAGPAGGGIAGAKLMPNGSVSVTNCYNAGSVSSTRNMGCIMAYAAGNNTFENNYYINTCSDENEGQGTSLSEDFMRTQEFVDYLNGRDSQVWAMDVHNINNGFPILTEVSTLEVSEQHEVAFSVYPNPAQGQFTVEGTGKMVVTNLFGQTILVREIDGQTNVSLPRGMYFVKLGNATRKIVME